MTLSEKIERFKKIMTRKDGTPVYTEDTIRKLKELRFFQAPASSKFHGDYEGGLFDHSCEVTEILVEMTENNKLRWEEQDSPYIVGMYHDLCKCDQYRRLVGYDDHGRLYEFNPNTPIKGHGDKSVMMLSTFITLTDEEMMCIRYHMGAFCDKADWGYFTRAVKTYPNVLWTHMADMIASQIRGV